MDAPAIANFGARQRELLTLLLEKKSGMTADELAGALSVSRSAVHQHLGLLKRDGYVVQQTQAPRGGRPGFMWRLTELGTHLFPKQYALFSDLLLNSLKKRLGSDGLRETMRELGTRLGGEQAARLAGKTAAEQIEEVAAIMRELGYQARTQADPGHALPMIDARNCIYHHLAREHSEVCELDLALLGTLLKSDIEHVECMLRGGEACRFRARPQVAHKKD